MWSKLSRNCIIEGPLDSFCLVCEYLVRNVDEIDKHIEDPNHGKRIDLYPYLEKYNRDRIRKIKEKYLCEYCSVILKTATKVNAHICTREHLNNRGLQQLTAGPDNGVIAFNEVLIKEDAWHAIHNTCCSLCEKEDDPKHKQSPYHLLKLAQSTIEFVENGLYRKIDKDTVQCLTCNILLDTNSISKHFVSEDHKLTFTKSKVQQDKSNDEIKTKNAKGDTPVSSKSITGKAKDDQKDAELEEIKKISKDNKITYNLDHGGTHCKVCDITMPSTLRSLKKHVVEATHVKKLKFSKLKLVTKPFKEFAKHKALYLRLLCQQYVIFNYKICIPLMNQDMITENSGSIRCHFCKENLNKDSWQQHTHKKDVHEIGVVTSIDNEYLREIHPGNFHCGFCNIVISKWDDIPNHLESARHKSEKESCAKILSRHLKLCDELKNI